METEAMRIAKEWADSPCNMGFICRAFLAQQARLAEVERERNEWRERADIARSECAAAESRLASARVEGARLQREAWVAGATAVADVSGCFVCRPRPRRPTTGDDAKVEYRLAGLTFAEHAARRYPAPAAPAGEQTRKPWPSVVGWPYSCDKCGEKGECFTGCGLAECDAVAIRESRPAPTPEPERWVDVPIMADVTHSDAWRVASDLRLRLTPEDCRRIVALGSRPTQTAEG